MSRDPYLDPAARGQASDAAVVADLASQAIGVVAEEGDARVVVVPAGGDAKIVDLSRYSEKPARAQGSATTKSVASFLDYVARHNTTGTTIWVEPQDGRVVAVLNDHGEHQAPDWGDLRAELALPVTPEWKHWMSRNGKKGDQGDFAEHIEEGINEIREPDGAHVLEVAQSIQATVTADFKSAHRLDNGAIGVQWVEDVDAKGGRAGDLEIPRELVLGISPFYGEAPYEIRARIRFRIVAGELQIGYDLDRPDAVIRDCLVGVRDRIDEAFPGQVYIGSPPGGHR
jgi:uncharacterized protein YfdQ (DUF2303 family)